MPDQLDAAQQLEERIREHELQQRKQTLPATGQCYNCAEPVAAGLHFCDADCDKDYHLRKRSRDMRPRFA